MEGSCKHNRTNRHINHSYFQQEILKLISNSNYILINIKYRDIYRKDGNFECHSYFINDDETSFCNYRPISLLQVISKVIEKVIYNQIYFCCTKYQLFMTTSMDLYPVIQRNTPLWKLSAEQCQPWILMKDSMVQG